MVEVESDERMMGNIIFQYFFSLRPGLEFGRMKKKTMVVTENWMFPQCHKAF